MAIIKIIIYDPYDHEIYKDYFKGPRMTVALRQDIQEKIKMFKDDKVVPAVFHTMINYGYKRVNPDLEMFKMG